MPDMTNVVTFFKPKKEPLVYECGTCGGQLWYLEANPSHKTEDGDYLPLHRCFRCSEVKDVFGWFTTESGELCDT